jgi:hypothetical protein
MRDDDFCGASILNQQVEWEADGNLKNCRITISNGKAYSQASENRI